MLDIYDQKSDGAICERTRIPLFIAPPRRDCLIYHPTTTTMPRAKARVAMGGKREEKIRQALKESPIQHVRGFAP